MNLAQDLLWLCAIPSLIGEEKVLCDAVQARLEQRPMAAPIRRYGDSIVVPVRRGSGGPHVVLGGHLDVVRTEHEGAPRIEGDLLYAPGAADMKSGLSLMLALAEHPGPWAVIVATVLGATLGLGLERWTSAPKSSR